MARSTGFTGLAGLAGLVDEVDGVAGSIGVDRELRGWRGWWGWQGWQGRPDWQGWQVDDLRLMRLMGLGRTPLSLAAYYGHVEVVKFLVNEASADVEAKSNAGGTPLSWAADCGNLEIVTFLVKEAGADVESKDKDGKTALDLARQGIREGWGWGGIEKGARPWRRGWRSKKSKHVEKPALEGGRWEHESRIQGKHEGTSLMCHRISYFIFHVFIFLMFIYQGFVQSYC